MERVRLDANKSCTNVPASAHALRPRRSGPATRGSAMSATMRAVAALRVFHPVEESVEDVQTLLVRSHEAIHEQSQSEVGLFAIHLWSLALVIHRCHFYLHKCGVLRRPHRGPPSSRAPAAPSGRRRPATGGGCSIGSVGVGFPGHPGEPQIFVIVKLGVLCGRSTRRCERVGGWHSCRVGADVAAIKMTRRRSDDPRRPSLQFSIEYRGDNP